MPVSSADSKKLRTLKTQGDVELTKLKEMKKIAELCTADIHQHNNFKARYKTIDNISSAFESYHDKVIVVLSAYEEDECQQVLTTYQNSMVDFNNLLFEIKAAYITLFGDDDLNTSRSFVTAPPPSHIRLKPPQIPVFKGEIMKWQNFRDMFDALVHFENYSNIEKFNYLIDSLEGPPRTLVTNIPLAGDNYLTAYNTLVKRYDKKRIIAREHWHTVERTTPISDDHYSVKLRILLDTFSENLNVLHNMGYPIKSWDFILFTMLHDRLPSSIVTRFETDCEAQLPDAITKNESYELLFNFSNKHCVALDNALYSSSIAPKKKTDSHSRGSPPHQSSKPRKSGAFVATGQNLTCAVCKGNHLIYSCPVFLTKSPSDRLNLVKANRWCTSCLGNRHTYKFCTSSASCIHCQKRHHSTLCFGAKNTSPTTQNVTSSSQSNVAPTSPNIPVSQCNLEYNAPILTTTSMISQCKETLLATAIIEIQDFWGNYQKIRAILDSASMSNFITRKCFNKLGLSPYPMTMDICGIGQNNTRTTHGTTCTIKPLDKNKPTFTLDFVVLPQICNDMPHSNLNKGDFLQFSHLQLADPNFNRCGGIDALLGADIYGFLLNGNTVVTSPNAPVAIDTIFGWTILGPVPDKNLCSHTSLVNCIPRSPMSEPSIDDTLRRFWELEEIPNAPPFTNEDKQVEDYYTSTLNRSESGQYIVSLPFREPDPSFFGSRDIALRRFYSLERRLLKTPDFHKQYCDFMQNQLNADYMEISPSFDPNDSRQYWIPHHAVLRPESAGMKLRVVYDASCPDLKNNSLNNVLFPGPKLQLDIVTILMNIRLDPIVFTGDIKEMFLRIGMAEPDRRYQKILWRFSPSEPICDYNLKTVVFGVTSSPFLACRTMLQLAKDCKNDFPDVSHVLETSLYIDDAVCTAKDIPTALKLQSDLIAAMEKGGFHLRKWTSNHPALLEHLPKEYCQVDPLSFDSDPTATIKILGLHWNFTTDNFGFKVVPQNKSCTKRAILSQLSSIFDPLGMLAPLNSYLKILMQQLWVAKLDWDATPPSSICETWNNFLNQFSCLSNINIPRLIIPPDMISCELHAMCDSSEKCYAGVVYLRTLTRSGKIDVHFICAKSKVAPIKSKLTIPRLELQGCLLLAKLLNFVKNTYSPKLQFSKISAYSDSTIALAWLRGEPQNWNTFVCNRVSKIQEYTNSSDWYHIYTHLNSCDPASRGLLPQDLLHNSLWWAGPSFLKLPVSQWPEIGSQTFMTCEEQRKTTLKVNASPAYLISLLDQISSLSKILRIVAYFLRFLRNFKIKDKGEWIVTPLSMRELDDALMFIIKLVQRCEFAQAIQILRGHSEEKGLSKLPKSFRKLSPFIDHNGILRVGGRLSYGKFSYEKKHPALLPSRHRLTYLLIEYTHKLYLHTGLLNLQNILFQRFWIISARRTIRHVLSKCITCFRVNPSSPQPIMAPLPKVRISQARAFASIGVDYGGPFSITMSRTRGSKTLKAYLCLFVCLATKLVHLELVSSLSTDSFLSALRRLIARRGSVHVIYSDCGTNFVGAAKELNKMMKNVAESQHIVWKFNPPSAPNFGGIFEAGIKATKTHLTRVVGTQILTFEELYTVFVQIESVLNSRPLVPKPSSDPNDYEALTPGHFVLLEPLNAPPDYDYTPLKLNTLSRWQLVQRLYQDFWQRWHLEYLHTLIQRSKWTDPKTPIELNTLVILKDERVPPLQWNMGRVIEVHPSQDRVIRVVTVKTAKGTFKRPVNKVCPLPIQHE